ncbi:type 2 isopentenyl-diphosphate Delta-isomerase [Nocardia brasiliensis]|uniref:type 2 isopentenyl-diphosphate Delta-isomerase n=1 Tax=Nocardia brasiliensis TaxID=37326 RepID=UPI0024538395|nr:type 2 isopentenyl-diphosphate Delta-isomerase [Nocardia brasiliensis]
MTVIDPLISDRKNDHVLHAVAQHRTVHSANDFDAVSFVHHALAGIDSTQVSLATSVAGMPWQTPFFINAMTGGSERTGRINRELAIAAHTTSLPIASGSMSAYLRDPTLASTYRVLRQHNPNGVVIANVNANTTLDQARRAVDLLDADALQIHLNAVQEIVMPEGDRHFSHWPGRIEQITSGIEVPVIVKEVGFGLSHKTVTWLRDAGVAAADVGGRGGTNFARIENARRPERELPFFDQWGQSTPACLLAVSDVPGIDILGSGGVRSPLDIVRSLALGAAASGVAGVFLRTLVDQGTEALIGTITAWREQLRKIMTVLGARTVADLTTCDLLLDQELIRHTELRRSDQPQCSRRTSLSSEGPR